MRGEMLGFAPQGDDAAAVKEQSFFLSYGRASASFDQLQHETSNIGEGEGERGEEGKGGASVGVHGNRINNTLHQAQNNETCQKHGIER